MTSHWTGKVKVTGEQILQIFEEFYHLRNKPRRFEDRVETAIEGQLPESISLEDRTTYIGTLSCILWIDRSRYQENPPKSIMINQKPNGCFKSKVVLNRIH